MRRNSTFLQKHVSMKLLEVSLSCLHFSLMFSVGEVKSPCFCVLSRGSVCIMPGASCHCMYHARSILSLYVYHARSILSLYVPCQEHLVIVCTMPGASCHCMYHARSILSLPNCLVCFSFYCVYNYIFFNLLNLTVGYSKNVLCTLN